MTVRYFLYFFLFYFFFFFIFYFIVYFLYLIYFVSFSYTSVPFRNVLFLYLHRETLYKVIKCSLRYYYFWPMINVDIINTLFVR